MSPKKVNKIIDNKDEKDADFLSTVPFSPEMQLEDIGIGLPVSNEEFQRMKEAAALPQNEETLLSESDTENLNSDQSDLECE
jgi:hypothetical protein